MLGSKKHSEEDKWRPRPGQTSGRGLLTVGLPLGRVNERHGDTVGWVSLGGAIWATDLNTYQLLEACRHGASEKWLRQRLPRQQLESARDFALQAGLMVKIEGKNATLRGRRCLRGLKIRRRNYFMQNEGTRRRFAIPEGSLLLSERLAGFACNFEMREVADLSMDMSSSAPEELRSTEYLEETIKYAYWRALRCLNLGLIWMDQPPDKVKAVKDQAGHILRPAVIWQEITEWITRPESVNQMLASPVRDDVLSLGLGVPLGNCYGDRGFLVRTPAGEVVEVSSDAYALMCLSSYTLLAEIAGDLQRTLALREPEAHGRILAAAGELERLQLIRLEPVPVPSPVEQTAN